MTAQNEELTDKAAALAARFDRSFALPRSAVIPPRQDYIAVRIRDDLHALRLPQLAELRSGIPITSLPGSDMELIGLASFRGAAVPVYDLGLLLGYLPGDGKPVWCALAAMAPMALAFDAFEGHLRLSVEASAAGEESRDARPHINGILRTSDQILPIIDLSSIIDVIARTTAKGNSMQEGE